MNKRSTIILPVILLLAVMSCAIPGQAGAPTIEASQAQAAIDAPKDGDALPLSPYEIVYHGSDMVEVTQVELSVNSVPVSIQANPSPGAGFVLLRYIWTPPAPGTYIIQPRAQNQSGEWGPYSSIKVTVEQPAPTTNPTLEPTIEIITSQTAEATLYIQPTLSAPTLNPVGSGIFTGVSKSTDKFYYGADSCGPKSVTFSVSINNPAGIRYVFIFVRLEDKVTHNVTEWNDGKATNSLGTGNYTVVINSQGDVPNYASYPEAWFGYQFVVQQPDGSFVRSEVHYDITLAKCP